LHEALGGALPDGPTDPRRVLDELAAAADPGIVAMPSGRYFGFVIGGGLPAALAADWLTSTWDQNAGLYVGGPAASVVEQVVREWVCGLLGLPEDASLGIVTGTQMGSVTALAAARFRVLERSGWDVARDGLAGGPRIRVIVGAQRHVTIDRAVRLLGLGTPEVVAADDQGRMKPAALRDALRGGDGPTIVCAQAGEVNTGAFDPFDEIADIAAEHGAWLHIDGAFGLWAAASPRLRHLVHGVERADSWITDAHKWLNVPYDSALVLCADAEAHRAAMTVSASYLIQDDTRAVRDQRTRRTGRAHVRVRATLRGGNLGARRRRGVERGRSESGAVPLRDRRADRPGSARGAGSGRSLDERDDVGRPPRYPHLGLELADDRRGDRSRALAAFGKASQLPAHAPAR